MENVEIARRFDELAQLLEARNANPHRIRAYRRAAMILSRLERPVRELVAAGGIPALERIRGIGPRLAGAINATVKTGRLPMLDRLRRELEPATVLQTVPGIGPVTAARLAELGIDTLEELETAAHDGRLANVVGLPLKTIQGVMDCLATRLARSSSRSERAVPRAERRGRPSTARSHRRRESARGLARLRDRDDSRERADPPIAELLDVDREYRESARAGLLRTIAPRRFNPTGLKWLPILRTRRGGTRYTALYSNTARAHQLERTGDWVVLYYELAPGEGGRQVTVVTEYEGPLKGRRVVRGLEDKCFAHYSAVPDEAPAPRRHFVGK